VSDSLVVAGRFELGNFEPWAEQEDDARGATALQLLQAVVPLAEALLRVLKLFSLVLTPVVCLVDCAEDAEAGWWVDLLTLFAGRR
jgi:hypothetical protein